MARKLAVISRAPVAASAQRIRHWLGLIGLLLGLATPFGALARDADDVKERLSTYMSVWSSGDYAAAAKLIHPDDLAGVKAHILPVFVGGLQAGSAEARKLSNIYFSGVADSKRAGLSGTEAFVQFLKFVAISSPELTSVLKQSKFEMSSVSFDDAAQPNATVKYRMIVGDTSFSDFEQLSKANHIWYVRTKEEPQITAAKFKALLQR